MVVSLEIFAYLFDLFVLFIFYETFFSERKQHIAIWAVASVYVVVQIVTALCNNLSQKIWCNFLVSIVGLLVLSFLYVGSLLKRMVGVVLYQVMAMLTEILSVILFEMFVPQTYEKVEMTELVVSKIILFLLVLLVKLIYRNKEDLSHKYLLHFLLVPILSIVILQGLYSNNANNIFWYLSLVSLLFLNLGLYYLLNIMTSLVLEESKKQRMQEQIEGQKEKYEHLTTSFLRGNRLLHDVNKHIRYMKEYLTEDRVDDALTYLNRMDEDLKEAYSFVNTGNLVIDSLVSDLQSHLSVNKCELKLAINIESCRLKIDDYDLVIVLGNIIDNAIEALEAVSEQEKKMVELDLSMTNLAFLIRLRNGMSQKKKRKKDLYFHGLGLQNVRGVVEKYGGSMATKADDGWFETMVVIPLEGEGNDT